MNIARCEAGHFYDSDSFSSCPHCRQKAMNQKTGRTGRRDEPAKGGESEKKEESGGLRAKLFGRKPRGDEYEFETASPVSPSELGRLFGEEEQESESVVKAVKKIKISPRRKEKREALLPQASGDADSSPSVQTTDGEAVGQSGPDVSAQLRAAAEEPQNEEAAAGIGMPAAVVGETVGLFTAFAGDGERTDPPVGWLVCVRGSKWGSVFPIRSGGNTVGRGAGNDIVIEDDNRVSREKHARVVYEPRNRVFYIEAGERSGLTYLNGENILHHATLSAYDSLEIGGGLYLFVPLCGEAFSWEDYPRVNDDA